MTTSRTGTATHKRMARSCKTRDRRAGLTHCPVCGVELDWFTPQQPNSAEADEIVPFSETGATSVDLANWRTICRLCNQRKGGRTGAEAAAARRADVASSRVVASPIW